MKKCKFEEFTRKVANTFTVDRCSAQSLERTLAELRYEARELLKPEISPVDELPGR